MFSRQCRNLSLLVGVVLSVLLVAPAGAAQVTNTYEDRSDPVLLLASLVNAINTRDYQRAWNYWETTPPNAPTLEAFAQGYADTQYVEGFVRLPVFSSAGAGNVYAEMPTLLRVTHTNGIQETFAGCYTLHKTNVPVGDNPLPDPNWSINAGQLAASTTTAFLSGALCSNTASLTSQIYDNANSPVDLMTSYFSAILQRDYVRAYNYWEVAPRLGQALQDFANGYASTQDITALLSLNLPDTSFSGRMRLPAALRSTLANGTQQFFGGCYVAHYNTQLLAPAWRFVGASIQQANGLDAALSAARCP